MSVHPDPHRADALAREALAKAETAQRAADIYGARFDERSSAIRERIEDLAVAQASARTEARTDHETASRALAHLRKDLEQIIADNAADVARRFDALLTTVGELRDAVDTADRADRADDRELERRRLSNGRLTILVGAVTALTTALVAVIVAIISHV